MFKADDDGAAHRRPSTTSSADAGKNNPQFSRQEGAAAAAAPSTRTACRVTTPGWRTDFLTQMGFTIPDSIDSPCERDDAPSSRATRSASVLDDADVLIWTTESDDEQAALLADPTSQQLRATKATRNVFTGKDLAGAIAFASVLSYPVVADQLPPLLARALA